MTDFNCITVMKVQNMYHHYPLYYNLTIIFWKVLIHMKHKMTNLHFILISFCFFVTKKSFYSLIIMLVFCFVGFICFIACLFAICWLFSFWNLFYSKYQFHCFMISSFFLRILLLDVCSMSSQIIIICLMNISGLMMNSC